VGVLRNLWPWRAFEIETSLALNDAVAELAKNIGDPDHRGPSIKPFIGRRLGATAFRFRSPRTPGRRDPIGTALVFVHVEETERGYSRVRVRMRMRYFVTVWLSLVAAWTFVVLVQSVLAVIGPGRVDLIHVCRFPLFGLLFIAFGVWVSCGSFASEAARHTKTLLDMLPPAPPKGSEPYR